MLQLAPCSDLWQLRSAAGSRAAAAYTTPQMSSAANTLQLNKSDGHLVTITKTGNVCGRQVQTPWGEAICNKSAPQINPRSLLRFNVVFLLKSACRPVRSSVISRNRTWNWASSLPPKHVCWRGCPRIHPMSLCESKDTSCNSAVARLMASKVTFPFRVRIRHPKKSDHILIHFHRLVFPLCSKSESGKKFAVDAPASYCRTGHCATTQASNRGSPDFTRRERHERHERHLGHALLYGNPCILILLRRILSWDERNKLWKKTRPTKTCYLVTHIHDCKAPGK